MLFWEFLTGHKAHEQLARAELDPGQSQRLDPGVLTSRPPELYYPPPGHKSASVTLDVQIQHGTADTG